MLMIRDAGLAGDSGLLFDGRRITMFKLSSRGLRRIALVLGFLVLTVLSDSGARMNKHAGLVLPQLGNVMALYGAAPVTIDRNARDFKLPDQFAWQERPGSPSTHANDGALRPHIEMLEAGKQRRDLRTAPSRRIAHIVLGRSFAHGRCLLRECRCTGGRFDSSRS